MNEVALQFLHWAAALVPVLVMLTLFIWLDAFALMNVREVLILVALGGLGAVAAYPMSGRLLDALPIGFTYYSRFVAPWIEEAIKAVFIIALFRVNRIGYKLDAVISGFAIGAGFSVVENIIYLTAYPNYGTGTWLVRGFGTAVMHGTTLAILAVFAHEFAERKTRGEAADYHFNLLWFVPGYLFAVALHTVFNQLPNQPMLAMLGTIIVAPVAIITSLSIGTAEAQRWLDSEVVEHEAQLAVLQRGEWPVDPAGQRVAALAKRVDPESARRIQRTWELRAWLVVAAEQAMIDEAQGDAEIDKATIGAVIEELERLKGALGPTVSAALEKLLPFSRNDAWEVTELRQRLTGR